MNRLYAVCGIVAILGYVIGVKEIFTIFSIICIVAIGFGYLLRGYMQDKFVEGAFTQDVAKQRRIVQVISRTITYSLLMGVLYYFLSNIVSWCVDIYCATAVLNLFKRKSNNNVAG